MMRTVAIAAIPLCLVFLAWIIYKLRQAMAVPVNPEDMYTCTPPYVQER